MQHFYLVAFCSLILPVSGRLFGNSKPSKPPSFYSFEPVECTVTEWHTDARIGFCEPTRGGDTLFIDANNLLTPSRTWNPVVGTLLRGGYIGTITHIQEVTKYVKDYYYTTANNLIGRLLRSSITRYAR